MGQTQLSESAIAELEKQAYRVIGGHTAVKTCGWTKKMVKNEGGCYKLKFYGIMSHQCMQMSPSISCANRCTFCWRGYKSPVSTDWKWDVDDPQMILDGSLKAHHDLLVGFKGNPKANMKMFEQSNTVKHVALSLTGEPIFYPRFNELLGLFNKNGISTFLVTNAQYPDQIRDLKPVTQLYISLDAPTKEQLKTIDVPLFTDYWERLHQSLKYMAEKKYRTCLRLTMIKDMNMDHPAKYAELIKMGDPDFLEIKAYMFVGASRQRLNKANMPLHEEVVEFTKELMEYLPDYEICSEHIPSRVVMVAKKKFKIDGKWYTWIDFPKYDELVNSGTEFDAMDYLKPTPATGISGKGTLDHLEEGRKKKILEQREQLVNEDTNELDFYKDEPEPQAGSESDAKVGGC